MSENYDRALKKEIMHEAYSGLVADFLYYFEMNKIDPHDEAEKNNPMVILFEKTKKTLHDLMTMKTVDEIQEVIGQFKLINKLLEQLRS